MNDTNKAKPIESESSFTKKLKDDIHVVREGLEKDSSTKTIAIVACVGVAIWFAIWSAVFYGSLVTSILACSVLPAIAGLLLAAWIKVGKNKTLHFRNLIQPFLLVGWIVAIVCFVLAIITSIGLSGPNAAPSWLISFSTLLSILGTAGFGLSVAATVLLFIAYSKGMKHE